MVNVDKDSGVDEEVTDTVAVAPDAAAGEEVIDESKFAFAMAPVVRLMKDELDKDKMIRSRVKVEMNEWLDRVEADMPDDVARAAKEFYWP